MDATGLPWRVMHKQTGIEMLLVPPGSYRRGAVETSLEALFDEANGHLAIGEIDEAVALYRRCVSLDPQFFDGWHALGMALLKTGEVKEAIGAGLMATTLRPNDLLAWKHRQVARGLQWDQLTWSCCNEPEASNVTPRELASLVVRQLAEFDRADIRLRLIFPNNNINTGCGQRI